MSQRGTQWDETFCHSLYYSSAGPFDSDSHTVFPWLRRFPVCSQVLAEAGFASRLVDVRHGGKRAWKGLVRQVISHPHLRVSLVVPWEWADAAGWLLKQGLYEVQLPSPCGEVPGRMFTRLATPSLPATATVVHTALPEKPFVSPEEKTRREAQRWRTVTLSPAFFDRMDGWMYLAITC